MSSSDDERKQLEQIASRLKISSIQRHFLLCVGDACCSSTQGLESWEYLKRRLKEISIPDGTVYRTKVGCLRVCQSGPVGLVYPEGIWYKNLTPNNIERVLQEHIVQGNPVVDLQFAESPIA